MRATSIRFGVGASVGLLDIEGSRRFVSNNVAFVEVNGN